MPALEERKDLPFKTEWMDVEGLSGEMWLRLLQERRPRVVATGWETPAFPAPEQMVELPAYVCHLAGSVRNLVPRPWLARGVMVSNWGDRISHCIAEHAVLLVLGALRNLPLWKNSMSGAGRGGTAAGTVLRTRSLRGRRVGIHGFGAIAHALVPLLRSFGATLAAYSEGVPAELFSRQGVRRCGDLAELFGASDILVELESLTDRSRGVVDRKLLQLLPEDAVFVNLGRGAVADEEALAELAAEGKIRLALDVYEREPLPEDSPLRKIEGVLLSPHIAGPTEDAFPGCGDFALENLKRYFEGGPVEGRITLEIYDRST